MDTVGACKCSLLISFYFLGEIGARFSAARRMGMLQRVVEEKGRLNDLGTCVIQCRNYCGPP